MTFWPRKGNWTKLKVALIHTDIFNKIFQLRIRSLGEKTLQNIWELTNIFMTIVTSINKLMIFYGKHCRSLDNTITILECKKLKFWYQSNQSTVALNLFSLQHSFDELWTTTLKVNKIAGKSLNLKDVMLNLYLSRL